MSRCERSLTAKPLHFVAVFLNIKIGVYLLDELDGSCSGCVIRTRAGRVPKYGGAQRTDVRFTCYKASKEALQLPQTRDMQ